MTVYIEYFYSGNPYVSDQSGSYYVVFYKFHMLYIHTALTRNIITGWIEYLRPNRYYNSGESGRFYVTFTTLACNIRTSLTRNITSVWIEYAYPSCAYISVQSGRLLRCSHSCTFACRLPLAEPNYEDGVD